MCRLLPFCFRILVQRWKLATTILPGGRCPSCVVSNRGQNVRQNLEKGKRKRRLAQRKGDLCNCFQGGLFLQSASSFRTVNTTMASGRSIVCSRYKKTLGEVRDGGVAKINGIFGDFRRHFWIFSPEARSLFCKVIKAIDTDFSVKELSHVHCLVAQAIQSCLKRLCACTRQAGSDHNELYWCCWPSPSLLTVSS